MQARIFKLNLKPVSANPSRLNTMKKQLLLLSAALINSLTFSNAFAKSDAPDVLVSSNVAITSNYVDRGLSQSNDSPAIQGGFDVTGKGGGFFAGLWASSRGDKDALGNQMTTMETQVYAGVAFSQNNVKVDLGVQGTYFPHENDVDTAPEDTTESFLGLEYQIIRGEIWYDNEGTQVYKQLDINFEVIEHLGLSLSIGHTNYLDEEVEKESTLNKRLALAADFSGVVLSVSVSQHDDLEENLNEITLSRSF